MTNTTASIGNQPEPVQSIAGWIIWMKRVGTAFNWTLPWASYQNGFGSIGGSNYWLGLERLYQLTNSSKYRLRIEMKEQSTEKWISAEYWSFSVGDNTTKYQLKVDG
jgi:Fibrinogen beta and gamma chains, C-terminal globular domain